MEFSGDRTSLAQEETILNRQLNSRGNGHDIHPNYVEILERGVSKRQKWFFLESWQYGQINLNAHDFVSFVTHGRTRLSNSFNLKTPVCKTSAFQASYFNRIV